jgi:uncharacterized protein (TIGR00725 family)
MQNLIGVIGSSKATKEVRKAAFEVGWCILKAGFSLICGGLTGVMEAACKGGAMEAGEHSGRIIGILPGTVKNEANPYVDIVIPSGIGYARNMIIACASDAIIAVSGGSGTLTELSMAWQYGKPIIVMQGLPGITGELIGKSLDNRRKDTIIGAKNAEQAISLIKSFLAA